MKEEKYRKQMQELINHVEGGGPLYYPNIFQVSSERPKVTMRTYGKVKGQAFQMVFDTGAEVSVISPALVTKLKLTPYISKKPMILVAANGEETEAAEQVHVEITFGDTKAPVEMYIYDVEEELFLIGREWMTTYQANISFEEDNESMSFIAQGRKNVVQLVKTEEERPYHIAGQKKGNNTEVYMIQARPL